jgi:V/A-type H+-transporting ATPase subunit A
MKMTDLSEIPGRVVRIAGPVVGVVGLESARLYDVVHIGDLKLVGEIIRLAGDTATVQVYEETSGLRLGEGVTSTGGPLSVRLGPGLLGQVYDGLQRPLNVLADAAGAFIPRGILAPALPEETAWTFTPAVAAGELVEPGDVLGAVAETPQLEHRILVPAGAGGRVAAIAAGEFALADPVAQIETDSGIRSLGLAQTWPVRRPRPVAERLPPRVPLITGTRVIDAFFPLARGGAAIIPGGFGTGKTVLQHALSRWSDVDVVVYIGCGERGNEMAEVLEEFPSLEDPRTGAPLMERTVLIANTSNMPVAAREASVYLGVTIAEYYRDMGYRVAVMVDSLSRWAEALREISARLQEMPGEEGYPTYLADRLGRFYERAGRVTALGGPERQGALTLICAISPPGGDLSEPVTQASLRVAGALWALDPALAHERQFPAVDWETSYSLYADAVTPWFENAGGTGWGELRRETMELLQRGRELHEIAMLVGPDTLQDADRLVLEMARLVREAVLAQSAYDPNDARSSVLKTWRLATLARDLHRAARAALESGTPFDRLDLAPARRALRALRPAADGELEARVADAVGAIAALGRPGGQP